MAKMKWDDAIEKALKDAGGPLHFREVADIIATNRYRTKIPANAAFIVSSYINRSMRELGDESPYRRVRRGEYTHVENMDTGLSSAEEEEEQEETALIQAFGVYWSRDSVVWKNKPRILGAQQPNADNVNFAEQRGVYVLYDRTRTVYVGRCIDRGLGQRLFEHTRDRLQSRWDRFSWFGVLGVGDSGKLQEGYLPNTLQTWIASMEALMLEVLEPSLNRRRGDSLQGVEYLQVEDPGLEARQREAVLRKALENLGRAQS